MVYRNLIIYRIVILFFLLLITAPTLSAEEVDFLDDDFYLDELESAAVNDPIEPFNRLIFDFNDSAYMYLLKPLATGYSTVVPTDIRGCVWNFFRNLEEPLRFVNCILQGRFEESMWVLSRFAINSVAGVFGLGNPATREFGIPMIEASLGETLATWGVGDGFYLVVPLYGSSTLRDITGTVVDAMTMSPYYFWSDDYLTLAAIYAGKETNKLSLYLNVYDDLKKLSFDPYVALRNSYFQNRKKIRDHTDFQVEF
ncbi:VacJ family lipoprotein [Desulfogranum marinum]|jgi:phospholipid-binding lipoprotein MlaA|uniref:MlaA family lipoprotein n=1 Tax=Desulfogranum marinum TaxID=453220 RepID=UPI001966A6DA|nr:VacJ family lipoprotein [Desulfogranum marinum]MBM9513893.1 VacJ family lipoprotein [Desulfogranum marinum]